MPVSLNHEPCEGISFSPIPEIYELILANVPWPAQEIAWRRDSVGPQPKEAILSQVDNPNYTHVVREVLTAYGTELCTTLPETEDAIASAETEFRLLRSLGIQVPKTKWHIFQDIDGRPRTLARVAIIDSEPGMKIDEQDLMTEAQRQIMFDRYNKQRSLITAYYASDSRGTRLSDLRRFCQYRFGKPRADAISSSHEEYRFTLVDIEPIHMKRSTDSSF